MVRGQVAGAIRAAAAAAASRSLVALSCKPVAEMEVHMEKERQRGAC